MLCTEHKTQKLEEGARSLYGLAMISRIHAALSLQDVC